MLMDYENVSQQFRTNSYAEDASHLMIDQAAYEQ